MKTFNVGQTYSTRSIGDHNCIYSFTILARTAKQITTKVSGKQVRRGLRPNLDGHESFRPFGTHSFAPIIDAADPDLSAVG